MYRNIIIEYMVEKEYVQAEAIYAEMSAGSSYTNLS